MTAPAFVPATEPALALAATPVSAPGAARPFGRSVRRGTEPSR
ncbi:hypothetical protein AB0M23_01020 [Streptomyces sp. NPDC052077]